jgi:hypothetical protein
MLFSPFLPHNKQTRKRIGWTSRTTVVSQKGCTKILHALRFKFRDAADSLLTEAFQVLLSDLITAHRAGFPLLRTQVYYPDSDALGDMPPDEFMIEVVDEEAIQTLRRFLQHRLDVKHSSIQVWDPIETMSPLQAGIWCYSYHAAHLRLTPAASQSSYPHP